MSNDSMSNDSMSNDSMSNANADTMTIPIQTGFATTMTIFFLVDILGNSLVILAIVKNPKLQITSNFYLFALAVTDIMIGCNTMLPATISVSANESFLPQWGCTITSFVDTTTLPLSLWILSASSLDRCVMIFRPLKYKTWINREKTLLFIGAIALSCALVCLPILTPLIGNSWNNLSFTCSPDFMDNLDFFAAYCFFTFPLPIIIVVVSYAIIFSVVTSLQCKLSRQKIRATMTVLAVIVCLLVCILPVWCRALYLLFESRAGNSPEIIPLLELSLHWLLFLHSSLNPCIYGLVNPQFQASFKKIIFFLHSDPAHSFGETRRYDGAMNMSVKRNIKPTSRSSNELEGSEKNSNLGLDNPETLLPDVTCSILRNNKTFLGLKFSKIGNCKGDGAGDKRNDALVDPDSDAYFESTIQATTHV